MLADRPDLRLGFKMQQKARRDLSITLHEFVRKQFLVLDALFDLVVVRIHKVSVRVGASALLLGGIDEEEHGHSHGHECQCDADDDGYSRAVFGLCCRVAISCMLIGFGITGATV